MSAFPNVLWDDAYANCVLLTLIPQTHTCMRCVCLLEALLFDWLDSTHCRTSNRGHGEKRSGYGVNLQCELLRLHQIIEAP